MRTMWLVLAVVGCKAADTDSDPVDTDTDVPTDTDIDDTGVVGPRTEVSGVVLDLDGDPVVDAQIRFCRGALCLNGTTDAAGAFGFESVQAFPHSFEVIGPNATYATGFAAVTLQEDVPKALTMYLPTLGTPSPLQATATWHDVAPGLRVELAASDLETPPFLDDATEIAGARVPVDRFPTYDGISDVKAMWYLEPFDYPVPAGAPLEITNDFGAIDGETYRVWVGSYEASEWLDAGTLTVTAGVLTGAAELPLISTIALSGPI